MVLINFHLSSRSTKTDKITLRSNSEEAEENAAREEAKNREAELAKETLKVELREIAVAKEQMEKLEKLKKIRAKEEAKIRAEEEARLREESKAREEEKNLAKESAKLKAEIKAKEKVVAKAKENTQTQTKETETNKSKETNKTIDDKEFEAKLEKAVQKRLKELPTCKGGNGEDGDGTNGTGILGGTNVFEGKINATDAVGKVGFTNYSVVKPPYKVKRCDQILLLPGKRLDPADYCKKDDAFMTMSIYMMNFFLTKDPNKLVESFPMYEITQIPSALPGAPGCTMWMTKTRSFPFCYASAEILDQVIEAYYAFLNCRKGPQGPRIAGALLKACDISKLDLTVNGPFGQQGPMYQQIIYSMDPSKRNQKKKPKLDDINPYYIYEDKVHVPGSFLNNIKTRLNPYGKNPYNANQYGAMP